MFDGLRKWAETIEVSPLVCAPGADMDASCEATALPAETIREIKADQIELLYVMDRGSGIRPIIAFFVTTWVLAGFTSAMPWAAMGLYCASWTWYHSLQVTFEKTETRNKNPEYWAWQFTLASLCTGLAWGLGAASWFETGGLGTQAIVSVVVLGIVASSVITRALHKPATLAFLLPSVLPLAASLLLTGTNFGFLMTAFGFVFVSGLFQWGKTLQRSQLDAIALKFQNKALVTSLSEERRVAEEAKDAAEAGSRAKTEFLATMSHEVRTPLNGILGMARILENSRLDEEQKEQLGVILDSGEMLNTVLNDILDLSKLEAGQLNVDPEPFKVRAVAESVVRLLHPGARHKGINVEVSADTSVEVMARGDAHRVRQVLLNLIGNAIKFTEDGEVTITIAAAHSPLLPRGAGNDVPQDHVVVAINDTGIGIAPNVLPELFQPFRQADQTTTRKYGGSGLGLAICKRLIDLMGGEIGAESECRVGSTFWFSLPAAPSSVAAAPMPEAAPVSAVPQSAGRLILLAEDNDLNAKVASVLLGKAGHEVVRTRDGAEAVAWIRGVADGHNPMPDLIFMDVRMPRMSGPEAAQLIREMNGSIARIPIIALTADVSVADMKNGSLSQLPRDYEGRFDGVLPKPITPDHLTRAINTYTGVAIHPGRLNIANPGFDRTQLDELIDTLGSGTVDELIESFVLDIGDLAKGIEVAAADGNAEELRSRAHNLAGAAASLGFVALADAARELNGLARAHRMDEVAAEVSRVSTAISNAQEIVTQLKSA